MKRLYMLLIVTLMVTGSLSAQNVIHRYIMRGSIIESSNGAIYLCIGKVDGAEVGQELDVYRIESKITGPKSMPAFQRIKTGRVKITEIVEEHYAKARVIAGNAAKGSIVELERSTGK